MDADKVQQVADAASAASIASIAYKFGWGGTATFLISWVVSSEFGVLIGVLLGLGGFLVTWYYKHKENKRQQELHEIRVAQELDALQKRLRTRKTKDRE